MYQPPHFREDRIEVQHGLIRSHPLGLLITAGPGGLQANAIPFLDAPEQYLASQMKGIVGIEIPIIRIEGKWKVSQNRPEVDRAGVVAGLRDGGEQAAVMATLVVERGKRAN
jgi:predicted FMN-binding regulatory protein PaiB